MGLDTGSLRAGAPADVVLLAPDETWIVEPGSFVSRSSNTPIGGWSLVGRVRRTLVGGATRYELDANE